MKKSRVAQNIHEESDKIWQTNGKFWLMNEKSVGMLEIWVFLKNGKIWLENEKFWLKNEKSEGELEIQVSRKFSKIWLENWEKVEWPRTYMKSLLVL